MNKIQVRRSAGTSAPVAGSLENGELAWVDHGTGGANGVLYIGDMSTGTALVKTIGGTGSSSFVTDILNDTALTGAPTAPTAAAVTNTTQLATTAFVQTAVSGGTVAIANASDTDIVTPAAGQVLIYDGVNSTWDNKALSGDVTINSDGLTSVISVSQTAVELGVDTFGSYVSTVTNTDNNLAITGVGTENSTAQINLATDVTIAGNLTVVGGTTTVESTVVTIEDPIFTLGENDAFTQDRGIAMKYGSAAKFAFMGMDRTDDKFKYIPDATNTGEVMGGSVGKAAFSEINGLLMDATQTNITEIGTITVGAWQGDAVDSQWGGTGINTSTSVGNPGKHTGVPSINGGSWDVTAELATSLGGTGLNAVAAGGLVIGAGAGNDMTVLTLGGTAGMKLSVSALGSPEWTDILDGGTF
jgi:hypothetical protein